MELKRQRQSKKAELGKRRSAASQNRMRIISSLGAEVTAKKGKQSNEDTFGMDDDDWNVYRAIVSLHVYVWPAHYMLHVYVCGVSVSVPHVTCATSITSWA